MKEREKSNREMTYVKTQTGFARYRVAGDPIYFEWFTLTHSVNRSLWRNVLERTVCMINDHVMDDSLIVETGVKDGRHYDIGMCKVCRIRLMMIENKTWKGPLAYGG